MTAHPQFAEDIDLLALGLLEGEERAALEAHLEACPFCQTRYNEARGLMALLALSAPPAQPSAQVRQQLLDRLREGREAAPKSSPATEPRTAPPVLPQGPVELPRFWSWTNVSWAAASIAVLLTAAQMVMENRRLTRELEGLRATAEKEQQELVRTRTVLDLLHAPDSVRVRLMSGSAPWPWPEGKIYYHPKKGLLFVASNLPPLDPGKSYQLWCVPTEGDPMSAGVFAPDERGNATVVMPPDMPSDFTPKAFAVTLEPGEGVAAPTGPKVLVGGVE